MSKALDAASLKRLMGHLNYTANEMDPKGKEDNLKKQLDAKACLKAWEVLEPGEKQDFLEKFEQSGGTKGKDSLKYCLQYVHTVSASKRVKVTVLENFYTRPLNQYC